MEYMIVIGGFVAALIAWTTILPFTLIDFRKFIDVDTFRKFGGIAIVIIALIIAGLKLPKYLPLLIVFFGFAISALKKFKLRSSIELM
ncbi:MAG: hypothetical protein H0Z28_12540 [Archaeoglobus sp.]|nr:hypothetical protein [Archaeoglobus sp.]